jgi:two-component system response regulator HydG
VVAVTLPPLRERERDALLLAEHHLAAIRERSGRAGLAFGPEARRALLGHSWPGNVRELMNAVERGAALARGDVIDAPDLLPHRPEEPRPAADGSWRRSKAEAEEAAIRQALKETGGVVSHAAKVLGVSRQHLHTRMRKLGIKSED